MSIKIKINEDGVWGNTSIDGIDTAASESLRYADTAEQMVRCRGCGKTLPVSEAKITPKWASCRDCFDWVTLYL